MKMWNLITQRAFNKSSHNTNNDLAFIKKQYDF